MSKLVAEVLPVRSVKEFERAKMFQLFARYYEHVSYEQFCTDLAAKDDVIVLRDGEGQVQGFSTLVAVRLEVGGKTHHGVFSGDTVVDRAHWGQKALGVAFLKYLLVKKLRHPLRPLWWFLISKGYKTYLLMANNFGEHYPSADAPTPAWARGLIDAFGATHFGTAYDPQAGLIRFERSLGQLRPHVAPITERERADPRIALFERLNPTWSEGTELCCLARMTWSMPFVYALKKQWQRVRALVAPRPAAGAPTRAPAAPVLPPTATAPPASATPTGQLEAA